MSKKLLLVILPLVAIAFAGNDVYWVSDPDAPRIPAAPGAVGGYEVPVDPVTDQPPFGTVMQQWSLTMSGSYAGSGVTWQRDSGKFFLMDQGYAGTPRVWKLLPSDPPNSITAVGWTFVNWGSSTVDIPWGFAWDDDTACFWMSNILDNSVYAGCFLARYNYNSSNGNWEWGGRAADSWQVGDGSAGGALQMYWAAGMEKWIDRGIFCVTPVAPSPGTYNRVCKFDPYTKSNLGRVTYGDQTSERGCALVPWDSAYILTCGWNADNYVKRDSNGTSLANVSASYGPADWAVYVPQIVNATDTVFVYCMNSHASNYFQKISVGMTWGQLPSVNPMSVRPAQILSPTGAVDSGQVITPRVVYRNMSEDPADSVDLHFLIDNEMDVVLYHDSTYVLNMPGRGAETISFTPWVPVGRDSMGCMAWNFWLGDSNFHDDTMRTRFLVRVRDIAITDVYTPIPGDTIDPGTVSPQVYIWNYGNLTMTFPMIFNIGPWFDTTWVVNMIAGGSRTVTSTSSWTATAGVWLCNINARVAGDIHPGNNDTSYIFYVRGTIENDVACTAILSPSGIMDTTPFVPQASYANYGTSDVTCSTYCWIDDTTTDVTVYSAMTPVMLMAGMSTTAAYPPCTLTVEGPYAVACSIHLATDQNWTNNAIHQVFRVGSGAEHDVLLADILAPTGTIDSGAVITPRAVVFNAGLYPETFPVWFQLPGGYLESVDVTALPLGTYDTLSFPNWTCNVTGGSYNAVAWTLLSGDLAPENDTVVEPLTVQKRDIGVSAINAPVDTVPDATMVEPSCDVRNYGTTPETFEVTFQIGLFQARETVIGLLGGATQAVAFSDSWLSSPGVWLSRAEVIPNPADPNPGNNVMYDTFWVVGTIDHDVAVDEITDPTGSKDTVGMLDVTAIVHNYGANTESFTTYFSIFDETHAEVYSEYVDVTDLAPGATENLVFPQADINVYGNFTARCSTFLATDQNWTNNLVTDTFTLRYNPGFPEGWEEVNPMPTSPSGKPVKRGAWAATNYGNGLIYLAKGYKTTDFYSYEPLGDANMGTWTQLGGMPYQIHPLWPTKPPRKGSKGATDNDNLIYVTQGNNTLGMWQYIVSDDTWSILPDVPLGTNRKKVKGGTDLAYVPGDTAFVYCLKGYKTEFYRFNIATQSWETLDDAPFLNRNKWDKGSWLVWDGDQYLYAHQAKYHGMFRYDLEAEKWDSTSLTGMPFTGMMGRRKKSKDGGSAALYGDFLYAMKGGNTQEFWKYDLAADTWTEKETIPAYGSTGRKKRVKYGADLVQWGAAPVFFTLKGNKTSELWRYVEPATVFSAKPSRSGVAGYVTSRNDLSFDVMPNPFAGNVATVRYSLPKAGPVSISIFDVAGRTVSSRTLLASRTGAVSLDLRSLSAGIYLVRLDSDGFEATRKLVVQH